MRTGIAALIAGYVLSQFYRAFLAVMTPVLEAELGATKEDLASASGLWFLAFALMQIPVGAALDRVGPRRTTAALLAVGAAGAAVFAMAQSPAAIMAAMVLIGIGCSSVLMASYYIFAREFTPAVFGTLAGMTVGIGSLGNIAASVPLTAAMAAFGWRETVWALAAITLLTAAAIALLVKDPEKAPAGTGGSLLDLLKMPAIWPILAMMVACYAPAGGLRGLWVGPYYDDVFGFDRAGIGQISLWMGLAMVVGNFAYGPLDRLLGTRKWLIFGGNALTAACLFGLWAFAGAGPWLALALLMGVGLFGASFPMVVAHGRAFFPPHLMGRGVTLLNLFGIAPVGIAQVLTGRIHAATPSDPAHAPYAAVFLFFAIVTSIGLAVYLLSRDRTD